MKFTVKVSMPHAALWVVQLRSDTCGVKASAVSMPHAALWVVQQEKWREQRVHHGCFNAARGFVGGATPTDSTLLRKVMRFNAARGFVGGATLESFGSTESALVSMPHAALWVVQPHCSQPLSP